MDGRVSDDEFQVVVDKLAKYQQLKSGMWAGAQKAHAVVQLDVETKTLSSNKAGVRPARVSHYQGFGISFLLSVHVCD